MKWGSGQNQNLLGDYLLHKDRFFEILLVKGSKLKNRVLNKLSDKLDGILKFTILQRSSHMSEEVSLIQ